MNFIIFVIDGKSNTGSSDEMQAIDAFNEKLQANGNWVTAAGIAEPGDATLIDNRNGAGKSQPGSLFDGSEHYSGFWIIKDVSPQEAHALALEGSMACNRRVELRPYLR